MSTPTPDHTLKLSVALIGMRGAGKSAVGREVSTLLGLPWLDTDQLISKGAGSSIAEIFAKEGEAGFRRRERRAVEEALAASPVVVSVGGGAVEDERNIELLRQATTVIWLTAAPDVLWDRIQADPTTKESRPSLTELSGLAEVSRLLQKRRTFYERASDMVFETQGTSPEEIARWIVTRIAQHRPSCR